MITELTDQEFNVLNHITNQAKMDWCMIYDDCIVDVEEDKTLSFDDGIWQIDSCLTNLDDYNLTEDEKLCYINLIYKIKMKQKMPLERVSTLLYNAICLLEENCGTIMGTDLEEELGITQEEYNWITRADCCFV